MIARSAVAGFALPLAAAGVMLLAIVTLPLTGWIAGGVDRVLAARAELARERRIDQALDRALVAWLAADRPRSDESVVGDVRLTDEGRRVDLTTITSERLDRLLAQAEIPVEAREALIARFFDWVDADDAPRPGGAEAPDYVALGLPPPAPWGLITPADVQAVMGWGDLAGTPAWRNASSTAGLAGVSPASDARPVVRVALAVEGHTNGLLMVIRRADAGPRNRPPWRVDWVNRVPLSPAETTDESDDR